MREWLGRRKLRLSRRSQMIRSPTASRYGRRWNEDRPPAPGGPGLGVAADGVAALAPDPRTVGVYVVDAMATKLRGLGGLVAAPEADLGNRVRLDGVAHTAPIRTLRR